MLSVSTVYEKEMLVYLSPAGKEDSEYINQSNLDQI